MVILDGKALSVKIKSQIKEEVRVLKEKGITPGLAFILVGDNPASQVYVNMKTKACEEVGIYSINHRMPKETTEKELIEVIKMLNDNPMVHGILVQLPLPKHISEERIIEAIDYKKDVDGFHPYNMGRLARGNPLFSSCTPFGIMKLFEEYAIDVKGKDVVMVGAGNITGKPMSLMLLNAGATVQVCHIYTQDLKEKTKRADILISAVGKPKLITEDMVKEGAIVVDVGISRVDNKVVGDVDFENVSKKVSYITPVPGGVGPMTIAMLLYNTLLSVKIREV
ncbi:bifunctional methylenetetrahydrofolate dehydrogenase/methenyltetrahydrofolate cyclohydrolase FolD [Hippea alviniae]|uniref:bifunctional methylenetetrahydrofolate dehydrogenase/methenyltetrahydrofolate cyclohydrolase FolD n=1 Tax=Hippea alviniae TaxID=1279027 RepID=UPI0003B6CFBA|nr:bifunctional methylenetetrahydrofolate dehydrogenase/methenyltetrahydrofolate cyclohydrolase FolD [Hippea alviniae]